MGGVKGKGARLNLGEAQIIVRTGQMFREENIPALLIRRILHNHHPIAKELVYEDQIQESKTRAGYFVKTRLPKFLTYLEKVYGNCGSQSAFLLDSTLSYVDLSTFQIIDGLNFAFPKAMAAQSGDYPHLLELHNTVKNLPELSSYFSSDRRIPFNNFGIFRHYPELDQD